MFNKPSRPGILPSNPEANVLSFAIPSDKNVPTLPLTEEAKFLALSCSDAAEIPPDIILFTKPDLPFSVSSTSLSYKDKVLLNGFAGSNAPPTPGKLLPILEIVLELPRFKLLTSNEMGLLAIVILHKIYKLVVL